MRGSRALRRGRRLPAGRHVATGRPLLALPAYRSAEEVHRPADLRQA